MKLENIKDLEAVIKLCRKTGVQSIKVDNVELQLLEHTPKKAAKSGVDSDAPVIEDTFTDEQILMWSAQGPLDG